MLRKIGKKKFGKKLLVDFNMQTNDRLVYLTYYNCIGSYHCQVTCSNMYFIFREIMN